MQVGTEYAIRRGGYGSVGHAKVLAIETVEVANNTSFARHPPPLKRRMARVRLLGGYYQRDMGIPPTPKGTERYVPGRDFLRTWEHEESIKANDERLRTEREQAANAATERFDGLARRLAALQVSGEPERATKWREDSHVILEMDTLDALLALAERSAWCRASTGSTCSTSRRSRTASASRRRLSARRSRR